MHTIQDEKKKEVVERQCIGQESGEETKEGEKERGKRNSGT